MLTNTQVSKIRKAFTNGSTADIKFSKTQLSKMVQLGGLSGNLIGSLVGEAAMTGAMTKMEAKDTIK